MIAGRRASSARTMAAGAIGMYPRRVGARLPRALPTPIDPIWLDRWLAAALTAGGELAIWLGGDAANHPLAGALVTAVVAGSVALRRRHPALIGAAVPVFAAVNFMLWQGPQFVGYPIANLCALYALAVWTPRRRFAAGLTVIVAVDLAGLASPGGRATTVAFAAITAAVMLLVRRVVRDRELRTQVAQRQREAVARAAVADERVRIARELHDAVGHHVSMIVLQAGAERRAGENSSPRSTREALETCERQGRQALVDLRRMLGMLRDDAPSTTSHRTQS
jgi:signal transduction histidine kinase